MRESLMQLLNLAQRASCSAWRPSNKERDRLGEAMEQLQIGRPEAIVTVWM